MFVAILFVFAIISTIIAVSYNFPLPYDEQYHMTLIQYYSHQISPFITTQPEQLAVVGDATRYGSYLMHYLLSFPLRAISAITSDANVQIISLRLINIGFMLAAFVLFRLFVIRLTGSALKANVSIGLLAALPATSLLAAHVNYDNLALLLFASMLLTAHSAVRQITNNKQLSLPLLLTIITLALTGSLVKFTFLPLAAVILAGILGMLVWHKALPSLPEAGWQNGLSLVAIMILTLTATGLFTERYIGNVVSYGTLQPDCAAVQPLETCLQYGPWARNYALEQAAKTDTTFVERSVEGFIANLWMPIMIRGLGGVNNHGTVAELPANLIFALKLVTGALILGIVAAIIRFRKNTMLLMGVAAAALYLGALIQRNYSEFMSLHEIVAVQGRYLLPLIVPIVAISFMGQRYYVDLGMYLSRRMVSAARYVRTIEAEEAYYRTANYWSMKLWNREMTDL